MAAAVSTPLPLVSEEIREGIAIRIVGSIPELDETDREALKAQIYESLGKTCSLNRTVYSKFNAKWRLSYGFKDDSLLACWWVDYELDDFGRVAAGGIGGNIGNPPEGSGFSLSGIIEEMPPDKFRRETKQPIPAAQVIKPKEQSLVGMTHSQRGPGKRRDV